MNLPIARQIAEAEQWVREMQNEAAKVGKGQELALYRRDVAQAIVTTLCWCRDNADELRDFRKAKRES